MNILERVEFTDKISNAIMSVDRDMKKGDAFVEAIEIVKQMENREESIHQEGEVAI